MIQIVVLYKVSKFYVIPCMATAHDIETLALRNVGHLTREEVDPGLGDTIAEYWRALATCNTITARRIAKGLPPEVLLASDAPDDMVQRVSQWGSIYFNSGQ